MKKILALVALTGLSACAVHPNGVVYTAPAPVYVAPAPVYVVPRPVYRPYYYHPYYAPRPYYRHYR
jgi:hypothetical protein